MNFIVYDLTFLVLFVIVVAIFLYKGKKNLKKEGLLLLYKTKWGIKLINYVGNKYKRTLKILSFVSITLGYLLMGIMIYLFYNILKIYISMPEIVKAVKIPPIMPLIPYIDKFVPGLPEFNFTYWIVIIAIIAVTHEFSHGIFAVYHKIKIKATGFGFFPFFFPVFLAAFVEPDEKQMQKKSKFAQMAILSAGTFANVLTAIFFFAIMWIFFSFMFAPAGVVFTDYTYSPVAISSITMIGNTSLINPTQEDIINIVKDNITQPVFTDKKEYAQIKGFIKGQEEYILLYENSPAINADIKGAITALNGVQINSIEKLTKEMNKYSPNEKVILTLYDGEDNYNYDITLGMHPQNKSKAYLGILLSNPKKSGIMGTMISLASSFKKPNIYYAPKYNGISMFIYNLLWWIVLISISVALINMLPVGIFDGGRFFYLTILGLTKNEKIAKKSFMFVTWLFLFLVLMIMVFWFFRII